MDSILGRPRHLERTVDSATSATNPAVSHLPAQRVRDGLRRIPRDDEALVGQSFDQGRDAAPSMLGEVHGERVAQFDAAQDSGVVHVATMTRGSDTVVFAQRRATRTVIRAGPGRAEGQAGSAPCRIRSEAGKSNSDSGRAGPGRGSGRQRAMPYSLGGGQFGLRAPGPAGRLRPAGSRAGDRPGHP